MDPRELIALYMEEDIATGDVTTTSLSIQDEECRAEIVVNESCVLAGGEEARLVFEKLGASAVQEVMDGANVEGGDHIMGISGKAGAILAGERLALNLLSRMSGIATATRKLSLELQHLNPDVRLAATRKTTPGFRYFEKKSVELGGGETHRQNLGELVLIKDNHLALVCDVGESLRRAKASGLPVEVEVESLDDALVAAAEGADIILLDNMPPDLAGRCYNAVKASNPSILVEVSGGITVENARFYARCADRISMSRLTSYSRPVDLSLHIV